MNNHNVFLLNTCIASVFSKKSIAGTSNKLRDTMKVVASCVDELGKSKIVPLPPQPVPNTSQPRGQPKPRRKKGETAYAEWDNKQYKGTEEQQKKDRENRRLIREQRQRENEVELARKIKALQPLGDEDVEEEEEPEAPPEPPAPTKPTKPTESTAAKIRRYEMERRKKAKEAREAEIVKAVAEAQNLPKAKSPGRAKPSADPKAKSPGKAAKEKEKPKMKSPPRTKPTTTKPKGKSPGRSSTGAKMPKAKEKPSDDAATNREVADTSKKTMVTDAGIATMRPVELSQSKLK